MNYLNNKCKNKNGTGKVFKKILIWFYWVNLGH